MKTFIKTSTKRAVKKVFTYEDVRQRLNLPEEVNIWVEPADDLEIISIEPGSTITAEYREQQTSEDKEG